MALIKMRMETVRERLTDSKETLNHEGRISRIEGIIEEIRARLAQIEADQRDMRREMRREMSAVNDRLHRLDVKVSSLWVGVMIAIGLLVKIAFFGEFTSFICGCFSFFELWPSSSRPIRVYPCSSVVPFLGGYDP